MRSILSVLSTSMLVALISLTRPSTSAEYEVLAQIRRAQGHVLDGVQNLSFEFSLPQIGRAYKRITRDAPDEKKMEILKSLMQERFDQLKIDFDSYEKMMDCTQAMEVPIEHRQEFYAIVDAQAEANRKSMSYLKDLPGVDDEFRASIDKLVERHDQYIKHIEKCVPRV